MLVFEPLPFSGEVDSEQSEEAGEGTRAMLSNRLCSLPLTFLSC